MKIQVTVTKNGSVSNQASFKSWEESSAWITKHTKEGNFGSPRWSVEQHQLSPEEFDEEGVKTSEAVFESVTVENPMGYEISEQEVADQTQEEINIEALAFLASTDWYVVRLIETGVDIPQSIRTERAIARSRVVV
jgi:hypothetical protein